MTSHFGDLEVADAFDSDNEIAVEIEYKTVYLPSTQVARLRDHLTGLLGDAPAAATSAPAPAGMTRAEALKNAEDTVGRLAPSTNARGYSDGVAPLSARTDAILSLARFLMNASA
ncbi:hypothetical protein Acy02nite_68260 [Actinoplanes cyaneus]|uniref:Uncharacterized protein n=1 Tax=Actinoplanes cyaneus TaxID=52696 RepID=A0A919M433_9ACTN|nr:hypothetical protein [Actinoplanes cyaneus]MCW2139121.1 hypothetical protein [Actinoplanes cyaneus]GID68945.1 hypothetical protein Acy02nite_68260 [Actinoplanes cyaneus]